MVSPIIGSFSCSAVFNVNNSKKPSYLTGICFIFCDDSYILVEDILTLLKFGWQRPLYDG